MQETETIWPPFPTPPSSAELPSEDGVPMETQMHRLVMTLLIEVLELLWRDRDDVYVGGNMFFYFSASPAADGRLECEQLSLRLGTAKGRCLGYEDTWLRWYTPDGKLLPTSGELLAAKDALLADYERHFGPLPQK